MSLCSKEIKLMGKQHFPVWLTQSQRPKEPVISDTETRRGLVISGVLMDVWDK